MLPSKNFDNASIFYIYCQKPSIDNVLFKVLQVFVCLVGLEWCFVLFAICNDNSGTRTQQLSTHLHSGHVSISLGQLPGGVSAGMGSLFKWSMTFQLATCRDPSGHRHADNYYILIPCQGFVDISQCSVRVGLLISHWQILVNASFRL